MRSAPVFSTGVSFGWGLARSASTGGGGGDASGSVGRVNSLNKVVIWRLNFTHCVFSMFAADASMPWYFFHKSGKRLRASGFNRFSSNAFFRAFMGRLIFSNSARRGRTLSGSSKGGMAGWGFFTGWGTGRVCCGAAGCVRVDNLLTSRSAAVIPLVYACLSSSMVVASIRSSEICLIDTTGRLLPNGLVVKFGIAGVGGVGGAGGSGGVGLGGTRACGTGACVGSGGVSFSTRTSSTSPCPAPYLTIPASFLRFASSLRTSSSEGPPIDGSTLA